MNPVKTFDILHKQTDKIFLIEFYQLPTTTLQINTYYITRGESSGRYIKTAAVLERFNRRFGTEPN